MQVARKAMGLSAPKGPKTTTKVSWLKGWYDTIATDRDYLVVDGQVIEKMLPERVITPYYELLGADEVMQRHEFFGIIRKIDLIYHEALRLRKLENPPKSKRPAPKRRS